MQDVIKFFLFHQDPSFSFQTFKLVKFSFGIKEFLPGLFIPSTKFIINSDLHDTRYYRWEYTILLIANDEQYVY